MKKTIQLALISALSLMIAAQPAYGMQYVNKSVESAKRYWKPLAGTVAVVGLGYGLWTIYANKKAEQELEPQTQEVVKTMIKALEALKAFPRDNNGRILDQYEEKNYQTETKVRNIIERQFRGNQPLMENVLCYNNKQVWQTVLDSKMPATYKRWIKNLYSDLKIEIKDVEKPVEPENLIDTVFNQSTPTQAGENTINVTAKNLPSHKELEHLYIRNNGTQPEELYALAGTIFEDIFNDALTAVEEPATGKSTSPLPSPRVERVPTTPTEPCIIIPRTNIVLTNPKEFSREDLIQKAAIEIKAITLDKGLNACIEIKQRFATMQDKEFVHAVLMYNNKMLAETAKQNPLTKTTMQSIYKKHKIAF